MTRLRQHAANKITSTLVLIAILFSSCILAVKTSGPFPIKPGIDAALRPYVDRFQRYGHQYKGAGWHGHDVYVQFGDTSSFVVEDPKLGNRVIGVCKTATGNAPNEIVIDNATWNSADQYEREALIFHELGHCAIDRQHEDAVDNDGIPISLMYPSLIVSAIYAPRRDYYIKELFSR